MYRENVLFQSDCGDSYDDEEKRSHNGQLEENDGYITDDEEERDDSISDFEASRKRKRKRLNSCRRRRRNIPIITFIGYVRYCVVPRGGAMEYSIPIPMQ